MAETGATLRDGGWTAPEAALIHWLRQRMSASKCPKSIDFERQFPRYVSREK